MNTVNSTAKHPSNLELAAFALGKISGDRAETLGEHIGNCRDCQQLINQTPPDTLLGILKKAKPGSSLTGKYDPKAEQRNETLSGSPVLQPVNEEELPEELRPQTKYTFLKKLGGGGMGLVYLAEHNMMKRKVAIKLLPPSLTDHPEVVERFLNEIRLAAKLEHINVVRAYGAEQFGKHIVLEMEFVDGKDLHAVVERKGPLPIGHAVAYIRQAATGLQQALLLGLIHRDIKPRNLMLSRGGSVKIADFGLAKFSQESSQGRDGKSLTGANAVMGTPDYMAPEQARNAKNADIRADIYSLGCSLYYLLTGKAPYAGETPLDLILSHVENPIPDVRTLRPDVSDDLAGLIERMMAKKPEDRPQTPKEVIDGLQKVGKGEAPAPRSVVEAVVVKDVKPAEIVPFIVPEKKRSGPLKWILAGWLVVALAMGGLLAAGAFKKSTEKPNENTEGIAGNNTRPESKVGEDKFVSIFNGKDLTGWVVDSGDADAWKVKDDQLKVRGLVEEDDHRPALRQQGYLLSEREYGDFALRFQFQQISSKNAWGGIAIRAVPHETASNSDRKRAGTDMDFPLHLTVLVGQCDPNIRDFPNGSLWWKSGSPPCLLPDNKGKLKNLGEWNDMLVELRGQSLRVESNGCELQNVMLNKMPSDADRMPGLKRYAGRIGFLKRVGEIHYRNIEIKELTAANSKSENGKEISPPSVVGSWEGSLANGQTKTFIFNSDHTVVGSNGFMGRWDQDGHKITVIKTNSPAGEKWAGEIEASSKRMKLTNEEGKTNTYTR